MSGATDSVVLLYAILLLSACGAVTDLVFGKIFNWLTLPALIFGLAISTWMGGWSGFASAIFAVLAGFCLYGWMYYMGAMGAGDVKFLMALGACGGLHFVVKTAVLGIAVGGICAVAMLVFRGQLKSFLLRMYHFFLTLILKELAAEKPKIDWSLTMPFGVPIAIAAAWVALGHPFEQMGLGGIWPN
jgi:prepilin peptidase CpaA